MTEQQPLTAQEISQIISQNNDAMMSKLSSMLSGETVKAATETDYSDVGLDEFAKITTENMMNNAKRTYDEYQRVSLEGIDKNRVHFDKTISDAQTHTVNLHQVALQALQNAVETTNQTGKQCTRHADIAIDRQWNVDEQAGFVAKILNSIQDPATSAAMAVAIAEAMLKKTS